MRGFGRDFKPNLRDFTERELRRLRIPRGWVEKLWTINVEIRMPNGRYKIVTIQQLIQKAFPGGELARLFAENRTHGRLMAFLLSPESRKATKKGQKDNIFTIWLYRERGGGGAIIVAYAIMPDGRIYIALLDMERPLLFQGGRVLQVIGGYPKEKVGTTGQLHKETAIDELGSELGRFEINPADVRQIGAPFNSNKAMFLTGTVDDEPQGISVQIVPIPHYLLVDQGDGTMKVDPNLVAVDLDRILEGVTGEIFLELNDELLQEVMKPSNGAPACEHTETAVNRTDRVLRGGLKI